jgi:heptosyltransferase-2
VRRNTPNGFDSRAKGRISGPWETLAPPCVDVVPPTSRRYHASFSHCRHGGREVRIAVILPNWIGDVTMATPALRALRKLAGSDGELLGLMRPYVGEVLAGTNWLDKTILYQKRSPSRELRTSHAIAQLRGWQPDKVVTLTNSIRTAWMAWRSGARVRVGSHGLLRQGLLNRTVDVGKAGTIDAYLQIAYAAGCADESTRLELATTRDDELAADQVWNDLKLPAGERVIVLNSGGAYGAAKHWPVANFAALARRLAREHGYHVLVNCGPAERDLAREIVRDSGDERVVSLADFDVPLGLTKACIRRSRLLVTTDSGPRFFGIAFGKPVVSLFGPTSPQATVTHWPLETSLTLSLPCQPCGKRVCPLGHHQCMRDLLPDRVFREIERLLTLTEGAPGAHPISALPLVSTPTASAPSVCS